MENKEYKPTARRACYSMKQSSALKATSWGSKLLVLRIYVDLNHAGHFTQSCGINTGVIEQLICTHSSNQLISVVVAWPWRTMASRTGLKICFHCSQLDRVSDVIYQQDFTLLKQPSGFLVNPQCTTMAQDSSFAPIVCVVGFHHAR